jgi:hypothetical protein
VSAEKRILKRKTEKKLKVILGNVLVSAYGGVVDGLIHVAPCPRRRTKRICHHINI